MDRCVAILPGPLLGPGSCSVLTSTGDRQESLGPFRRRCREGPGRAESPGHSYFSATASLLSVSPRWVTAQTCSPLPALPRALPSFSSSFLFPPCLSPFTSSPSCPLLCHPLCLCTAFLDLLPQSPSRGGPVVLRLRQP